MRVFVGRSRRGGAGYQVQLAVGANGKPHVLTIMKRFRYRIQLNDIGIKLQAFFKVLNMYGNMV